MQYTNIKIEFHMIVLLPPECCLGAIAWFIYPYLLGRKLVEFSDKVFIHRYFYCASIVAFVWKHIALNVNQKEI
jgi:hypothetical protein